MVLLRWGDEKRVTTINSVCNMQRALRATICRNDGLECSRRSGRRWASAHGAAGRVAGLLEPDGRAGRGDGADEHLDDRLRAAGDDDLLGSMRPEVGRKTIDGRRAGRQSAMRTPPVPHAHVVSRLAAGVRRRAVGRCPHSGRRWPSEGDPCWPRLRTILLYEARQCPFRGSL